MEQEQPKCVVFHYKKSNISGDSGVAEVTLAARFPSKEILNAVLKRFTNGVSVYVTEDLLQQVNAAMVAQVEGLEEQLRLKDQELTEVRERLAQALSYQQAGIPYR